MQPTASDGASAERLTTGDERLDGVLGGGIPCYSAVFIAGLPGSGKTVLSQQALFANARQGRKGLYLSTISEPPLKVLRFLQAFGFYDPGLFQQRVVYGELESSLRQGGPAALLRRLDDLVREHRPHLVVIDSFKALRDTIREPLPFREFTSDLAVRLAAWEVTTLLVGEYSADDIRTGAEFAIADGILYLYGTEETARQQRYLRVMKMRGTAHFPGEHLFDIGDDGIAVYPRMNPEIVGEYEFPGTRTGSAIEGLTGMLDGGVFESTSTLISGATGAGKTLTALSFLVDGAHRDQPSLFVSFEESPQQIVRNAHNFGWDLQGLTKRGLLEILHVSPSELDVDRHAYAIKERADRSGARLVAIDSITAFQAAVPEAGRYRNYLWALSDYFKRHQVSLFMTTETGGAFAPLEISSAAISFICDNIIFLRFVEDGGIIRRTVGVLKMRGSGHDAQVRELIIAPPRLRVGSPIGQNGVCGSGRQCVTEEA